MTFRSFGQKLATKRAKYGGHFEIQNGRRRHTRKNWTNSGRYGIYKVKSIGSTSVSNFALDYITPCRPTIVVIGVKHTHIQYTHMWYFLIRRQMKDYSIFGINVKRRIPIV